MKEYLIESFKIVKKEITLIIILALMPALLLFRGVAFWLALFIVLFLIPAAYGYFTETIIGKQHTSFLQIFKRHWLNYYLVASILYIPPMLLKKVSVLLSLPYSMFIAISVIYIFPLVFLKEKNIEAIPEGIKYLFRNFNFSLPLMILMLFQFFIRTSFIPFLKASWPQYFILSVMLVFLQNLLGIFIQFTVFVTASMILRADT